MITELLTQVDSVTQSFVFNGYQGLVSAYKPAIFGLVVLSIITFGYALLHGWIEMSMAEIGKKALIIGFVLVFALNWGSFSSYVYNFFTKAPNEISVNLLKAIPGSSFTDQSSANQALDMAWSQGMQTASAIFKQAGMTQFGLMILSGILFILVCIFVGLALLELVVAKVGLAIFLVLAPIIIPLFLFRIAKEAVFDGWFKQILTFALIPIFVMTALALGLMLMSKYSDNLAALAKANQVAGISDIAPFVLCIITTIGLLLKSASMSATLANGFATGAANHFSKAGAIAGVLATGGGKAFASMSAKALKPIEMGGGTGMRSIMSHSNVPNQTEEKNEFKN